ncbi:MAG: glycosyltransferase family 4 protein [Thermoanaerobaculia bacterium]
MPRLLFVTGTAPDVPEGSGTHIGISVLREALEARGNSVEVLAPAAHRGPVSLLRRLQFNVRARRVARGLLPRLDLIVGFDLDGFLVQSGSVRRVAAIKGVLADESGFEHGLPHVRLTFESLLEKRHVRQVDRILTSSAYSAGRIAEEYDVPANRIAVVPEPIDLARWRRAFEAAPKLPRGGGSILCVAHLYPRKNVATLLAAMTRLSSRAVLRVVGTGPDLARLERLSRELGLGERVEFLGHVDFARLAGEYRRADVFCLPSRQEGFGIVFLEAMAAGLPIVAARTTAVIEVVIDGECGNLVSPDRPDDLAAALDRLLSDPGERRRLGETGRRRVTDYEVSRVSGLFLDAVGLPSAS